MDRYKTIEFSKIYKRLMDVELLLKQKVIFALKQTYSNKMFYRLIPYLKSLSSEKYAGTNKKNKKRTNRINDIIASKDAEEMKLKKVIKILYLSDLLKMLTEYNILVNDRKFNLYVFGKKINLNEVKQKALHLKRLRNSVMHFDYTTYADNEQTWLSALIYWEKLIEVPKMQYIHNLSLNKKPRITTVLKALSDTYPDFLSLSDRLVCDMFDDIAFINGWGINELPQYWSIGRALYELRRQKKKKQAL